MNNVAWKQIHKSENIETWAGKQGAQFLLLNATYNQGIGQGWLTGAVNVVEDINQEGNVATGHQCFVFEVAAVEEPTVKAQEAGEISKLVLAPTAVLASTREAAIAIASKGIKGDYEATRTRFIVRQFMGNTGG